MFGTPFLYEHEEEAMKMLVKEAVWYHNFKRLTYKIFHMKNLTREEKNLVSVIILKCGIAMSALGDIMYLVEMRQWCDSQDNLSLILNGYRSKFYEELSKTADKVTLFKSQVEAFKAEAELLDTEDLFHSVVFRRYEKFEIEALFAPTRECTVIQNQKMDNITKNPEISNKKRKCPFEENEYVTESHKTQEIHPSNLFAGNESILMDRSKPESSKAMDLLLEKTRLYDGYVQCMDEFAHGKNATWEQKELVLEVSRKFEHAFKAVVQLMYQVERREWCDKLDELFLIIHRYDTNLDKELAKIDDKGTQFRDYVETLKSEGKFLCGSYLYPHYEYFQIKVFNVQSRLNPDSLEKSDFITENLSPVRHEDTVGVVDDGDDWEYLLESLETVRP